MKNEILDVLMLFDTNKININEAHSRILSHIQVEFDKKNTQIRNLKDDVKQARTMRKVPVLIKGKNIYYADPNEK